MAPKIKTLNVSATGQLSPGPDIETPPAPSPTLEPTPPSPTPALENPPPPVPAANAPQPAQAPPHPFRKVYVNKSPGFLDSVTAMEIPGLGVIVKTRYRQGPLNEKGLPIQDDGTLVPGSHQTSDAMVFVSGAALTDTAEGGVAIVKFETPAAP